ncbi:hypothetical protein V8F06_010240 [Rhypophila decipiens]
MQQIRRSTRTRTIRRPYDLRLTSPELEAGLSDAEVQNTSERDQDAAREKRSCPIDDESHHNSHLRKKSKVAGNSVVSARRQDQEFIDYDEVFRNGNAKIKYNIVEFPKESGKWYILRCLEHNMHFFRGALQAGAKHLNSGCHNGPRKQDRAFEMFHVQVLNCDAAKAEKNNLAVKEAAKSGYEYPRAARTRKARGAQRRRPRPTGTIIANLNTRHSPAVQATMDPTVGEVYKISWLRQPALAVVLPMANLSVIGMTGPAVTALGFTIPRCYRFLKMTKTYGWENNYRDGQERVRNRKYPILAFCRGVEIPKFPEPFALPLGIECYDFLKRSKLTMVNMDDPEVREIESYKAAKAFHERMKAWRASTKEQDSDEPGSERGNTDRQDGRDDGDQWNDDDDDLAVADSDDESADSDSDSADSDADSVFGTARENRIGHDGSGPFSCVGLTPNSAQPAPSKQLSHHARESSLARVGSNHRVSIEPQPGMEPPAKTDFPLQALLETDSSVEGVGAPEDMDAHINDILRKAFPNVPSTIPSRQLPSSFFETERVQHRDQGRTRQFSPDNGGNPKGTTFAKPGRAVADMSGGVDKSGMPMRTFARAPSRLPSAGEGVMADKGESGSSCERTRSTSS